MNEYLAIQSGGYLYEQPSSINCSVAGCFLEKLSRCLTEHVCQGSNSLCVSVKRFEQSSGLDTALYKNLPIYLL